MPTAAKFFSALLYAGFGYGLAFFLLEEEPTHFTWDGLPLLIAVIGLFHGWLWVGTAAEKGLGLTFSASIGAAILIHFWTVFFSAGSTMIGRSSNLRYNGFMDAMEDMAGIFAQQGAATLRLDVAVIVVAAGLLFGGVAFAVAQLWR